MPGAVTRPALTAAVVRIGGVEIDMRRHEVRRGGETIRLQEQPFQILALLMEHAGGVVTRQDIERRLWPDGTTVDFEHSVNAAIRRLRVGSSRGPTGGSLLSQATWIQRIHTAGGVAPATGCTQSTDVGALVLVPYSTDYVFFH